MSYTVVYSKYNGYPGSTDTYDFRGARETPLLPDVNLYNSFNFEVKSTTANANASTTQESGAGSYGRGNNYRTTNYRTGTSTRNPHNSYFGTHVARVPTAMRWVDDQGPEGNAIAQNELGDWFTRAVLERSDNNGGGVKFVENAAEAGNFAFTFVTSGTDTRTGQEKNTTHTFQVPHWNTLSIKGSYNAAVFCRNEFGYTNDYEGGTYTARSLWELPEKFDRLYKFIPDQREFTTLTFKIEVDWQVYLHWGIYGQYLSSSQQQSILSKMGYNSANDTGTDTHTITHVVNNSNNDYEKILRDILNERQRTPEEIDERYNQTFPKTAANTTITPSTKIQ